MENQLSVALQLLEQLYEFSTVKNYSSGEIILDENASIRSIPINFKNTYL